MRKAGTTYTVASSPEICGPKSPALANATLNFAVSGPHPANSEPESGAFCAPALAVNPTARNAAKSNPTRPLVNTKTPPSACNHTSHCSTNILLNLRDALKALRKVDVLLGDSP